MNTEEITTRRKTLLAESETMYEHLRAIEQELYELTLQCRHDAGAEQHLASCAGYRREWSICNACGKELTVSYPDDESHYEDDAETA